VRAGPFGRFGSGNWTIRSGLSLSVGAAAGRVGIASEPMAIVPFSRSVTTVSSRLHSAPRVCKIS
jgi:hypothetical protein